MDKKTKKTNTGTFYVVCIFDFLLELKIIRAVIVRSIHKYFVLENKAFES